MNTAPDTPVTQLVTGPAMTVDMNQAAAEVRAAMNRRGVLFAAVCQDGRVTAVLDRRNLNRQLAAAGRWLRVRDVVHPGMACLRPTATVSAAARLMHITGSAAVPVVDEHHRLIGLVTADAVAAVGTPAGATPV
ncbi:MAG TPA: CBS domain-containing protein [Pseudonocardiaceae bacterium]|jgi:CBS domain-containing protein